MAKMEPIKAELVFDADGMVDTCMRFAEACRIMAEGFEKAAAVISRDDVKPLPDNDVPSVHPNCKIVHEEPAPEIGQFMKWQTRGGTVWFESDNKTVLFTSMDGLEYALCIPPGTPNKVRVMTLYLQPEEHRIYMRTGRGKLTGEIVLCEFQVLGSRALPATLKVIDE